MSEKYKILVNIHTSGCIHQLRKEERNESTHIEESINLLPVTSKITILQNETGVDKSLAPGKPDDKILSRGALNACSFSVWNLLHVTLLALDKLGGS